MCWYVVPNNQECNTLQYRSQKKWWNNLDSLIKKQKNVIFYVQKLRCDKLASTCIYIQRCNTSPQI